MKKILSTIILASLCIFSFAQQGGISADMLAEISKGYEGSLADRAIRNALNTAPITTLAANAQNPVMYDKDFTYRVHTKGITNQKSSGRCWLFSGLNVLRADVISKYGLDKFEFSECYCFFWDQLEKSNLFLQAVIDTREKSMEDREVDWLFSHPLSDGGTFTGVADLVMKYGVVPSYAMPESFVANRTSEMQTQLKTLLRQDGMILREIPSGIKAKDIPAFQQKRKVEMLKDVYHILALSYGVPPIGFEWKGKEYTPLEYYQELLGYDLQGNYVLMMNDPTKEYWKVYEVEYDRHAYDGHNWKYVNLPMEEIKKIAIESLKEGKAMYFSCDVGKCLDRTTGICDVNNFDFEAVLGVGFTMDKRQRILSHASGSSHAMTLVAVDINDEKPIKWMVENSWGENFGYKGNIIMTDEWFDEYMFRLVAEKRFLSEKVLRTFDQKSIILPAWDPMYMSEQ